MNRMNFWSKAFRCTATFLILFAAVEVFACDLLPSSSCYISQSQDKHTNQGQESGDHCLCCCSHIVVMQHVIVVPQMTTAPALPQEILQQPFLTPSTIDHPPQLS